MAAIEPMLAEFCRHSNRMAKFITQQEFLDLANNIIVDTPTSDRVKEFRLRVCGLEVQDGQQQRLGAKLGAKYFYNFMARHDNILVHTTKIIKKCLNRIEWATYKNVEKMYKLVYKEMVAAEIAEELDNDVFFRQT
jgi:hypothetical protein